MDKEANYLQRIAFLQESIDHYKRTIYAMKKELTRAETRRDYWHALYVECSDAVRVVDSDQNGFYDSRAELKQEINKLRQKIQDLQRDLEIQYPKEVKDKVKEYFKKWKDDKKKNYLHAQESKETSELESKIKDLKKAVNFQYEYALPDSYAVSMEWEEETENSLYSQFVRKNWKTKEGAEKLLELMVNSL